MARGKSETGKNSVRRRGTGSTRRRQEASDLIQQLKEDNTRINSYSGEKVWAKPNQIGESTLFSKEVVDNMAVGLENLIAENRMLTRTEFEEKLASSLNNINQQYGAAQDEVENQSGADVVFYHKPEELLEIEKETGAKIFWRRGEPMLRSPNQKNHQLTPALKKYLEKNSQRISCKSCESKQYLQDGKDIYAEIIHYHTVGTPVKKKSGKHALDRQKLAQLLEMVGNHYSSCDYEFVAAPEPFVKQKIIKEEEWNLLQEKKMKRDELSSDVLPKDVRCKTEVREIPVDDIKKAALDLRSLLEAGVTTSQLKSKSPFRIKTNAQSANVSFMNEKNERVFQLQFRENTVRVSVAREKSPLHVAFTHALPEDGKRHEKYLGAAFEREYRERVLAEDLTHIHKREQKYSRDLEKAEKLLKKEREAKRERERLIANLRKQRQAGNLSEAEKKRLANLARSNANKTKLQASDDKPWRAELLRAEETLEKERRARRKRKKLVQRLRADRDEGRMTAAEKRKFASLARDVLRKQKS